MQQRESCLMKIHETEDSLSPKERQLASYILRHAEDVVNLRIDELKIRAGVSTSTVIRLSKALGFAGYKELCRNLYTDLHTETISRFEDIHPGDEPETVIRNIALSSVSAIENTLSINSAEQLNEAVNLLCRVQRVDFYGVGTSGLVASDAAFKFIRLGKTSYSSAEAHNQILYAMTLKEGDAAMLLSYSGETGDILNLAREIKATGATVITLTRYGKNSLAEMADIRLYASSRETLKRSGAMSSRIAQLVMTDTLYASVCSKMYDKVSGLLEESVEAIERMRGVRPARR